VFQIKILHRIRNKFLLDKFFKNSIGFLIMRKMLYRHTDRQGTAELACRIHNVTHKNTNTHKHTLRK